MVMVVVLHSGTKVVSCIPSDGNQWTLAQKKVKLIENNTIFMSQSYIIFLWELRRYVKDK